MDTMEYTRFYAIIEPEGDFWLAKLVGMVLPIGRGIFEGCDDEDRRVCGSLSLSLWSDGFVGCLLSSAMYACIGFVFK